MSEQHQRMDDGETPPDEKDLAAWLGKANYARWTKVVRHIEEAYPGVFKPDWVFGGKKHGWGLRFKKSKSFCTLIPERNRFLMLIVFGAEEREKAEAVLPSLVSHVRQDYKGATTYHDGKWMLSVVDDNDALEDLKHLLAIKRKPKGKAV